MTCDLKHPVGSSTRKVYSTGKWRPTGCLKLQVIFRKRTTNYRDLLRKMTCKDKVSCGSSPPCIIIAWYLWRYVTKNNFKKIASKMSTKKCFKQNCWNYVWGCNGSRKGVPRQESGEGVPWRGNQQCTNYFHKMTPKICEYVMKSMEQCLKLHVWGGYG